MTAGELFPAELLEAAQLCAVPPERRGIPFSSGAHRSLFPGDSSEFQDYRAYTPGDDLRRIDWNIFRRTRRLLLRRFRNFPRTKHLIVLDGTRSVRCAPERVGTAWRIAFFLGTVLLSGGDPVTVCCGTHSAVFPAGSASASALSTFLMECFHAPAEKSLFPLRLPAGAHSWVVSDFLVPEGLARLEQYLKHSAGFTPLRIRNRQEELNPGGYSGFRLIDSESGTEVAVSSDCVVRYMERLEHFESLLTRFAERSGGGYQVFDCTLSVPELIHQCRTKLCPEVFA